jgi:hypothetical protein
LAGSNISGFATGNQSGKVKSGGAPISFDPKAGKHGDTFVIENQDAKWAAGMKKQQAAWQIEGQPVAPAVNIMGAYKEPTDPAMVERYFADPAGFTKAVMNQPDPTPTPTPEPVWARFHWIKSRAEYDALPTGSMYYYVLPDGTHAISGDGRAVDLFSNGDRRHVNPVLWIRDRRFDGDYFLNHPDAQ